MSDNTLMNLREGRHAVVGKELQRSVETMNSACRARLKSFGLAALVLAICFGKPLFELVRFAWHSQLYSHILLIPFISLYLVWIRRNGLKCNGVGSRGLFFLPLIAGAIGLVGYWVAVRLGWKPRMDDYLALMTFSFLAFVVSGGFAFLGAEIMRAVAFPAAFLLFMVPFPTFVLEWIEAFLQYRSADAAQALFTLAGMPLLRHGTEFQLPGFPLQVAPECSGIHSTLVLFITSFLAGYMCLRSPWRRTALALAVIPLALLRNGFRIVTIGELCVNISPDMINSYIHRKGGPIFFVLSLIPFFLLLIYLRRSELKHKPNAGGN